MSSEIGNKASIFGYLEAGSAAIAGFAGVVSIVGIAAMIGLHFVSHSHLAFLNMDTATLVKWTNLGTGASLQLTIFAGAGTIYFDLKRTEALEKRLAAGGSTSAVPAEHNLSDDQKKQEFLEGKNRVTDINDLVAYNKKHNEGKK